MMASRAIRLAAVGDIALNGGYAQFACKGEAKSLLDGVARLVGDADLAIGDLEGSLTEQPRTGSSSRFCRKGHARYAPLLRATGFQVLSFANKHIMDFGWEAVKETLSTLAAVGIRAVCVGRNLGKARQQVQLCVNGLKASILAYCGGSDGRADLCE